MRTSLPELKLSVSEAARRLGVSRQQLHRTLSCTHGSRITVEMALRFGRLAGNGTRVVAMNVRHHGLWYGEKTLRDQIELIRPAAVPEA